MTVIQIVTLIFGILAFICGGINITVYIIGTERMPNRYMLRGLFLIIGGGIVMFVAIFMIPKMIDDYENRQAIKQSIKDQAVSEYTFYLDGEQIDPKTINLDAYEWSYDNNNKIVTLTKSESSITILYIVIVLLLTLFATGVLSNKQQC